MSSYVDVLPLETGTTATRESKRQLTHSARGLIMNVRLANRVTSAAITPRIQVFMGDAWVDYFVASALSANGDSIYVIGLGARSTTGVPNVISRPPPFSWRVVLTFSGTNTVDTFCGVQVTT